VDGGSDDGYRLHALRKLREQEETAGKQALAAAIGATVAARDELGRRADDLARARQAERDSVDRAAERAAAGDASAHDMVAARQFRERLAADVARAEAAVAEAQAEVERHEDLERVARDALADAIRERKAVDAHYQRWQADRKRVRDRKQEQADDDVAQSIHRRNKR
jgi:hypothetical protein